jgi:hypothetical protein
MPLVFVLVLLCPAASQTQTVLKPGKTSPDFYAWKKRARNEAAACLDLTGANKKLRKAGFETLFLESR